MLPIKVDTGSFESLIFLFPDVLIVESITIAGDIQSMVLKLLLSRLVKFPVKTTPKLSILPGKKINSCFKICALISVLLK